MTTTAPEADFAYRPLYAQVRDRLVRRLVAGEWKAGQLIASEVELARELGVSQGTVRKALDAMTGENLLVRRQGRGTYVAEPEDGRMLFQFFKLSPDDGQRAFPTSRILSRETGKSDRAEADLLSLEPGETVFRFARIRLIAGRAALSETIVLPARRYPGFDALPEIPNNVYQVYSARWGITIARAREKLKATSAGPTDAEALGCNNGHPLLAVDRLAFDLDGAPVEWRVSRCLTERTHYLSELR